MNGYIFLKWHGVYNNADAVFSVRGELNFYTLFRWALCFKGLKYGR